jgi:LuxR family maltose regulon positive regulatory protein
MAERALELLPFNDVANRGKVGFVLGHAYFTQGQFSQAIAVLSQNIRKCMDTGTDGMIAPSLATISKIYRLQGRLHDVIGLLEDKRQYIESRDAKRFFLAGSAYIGPSTVFHEWNNLEAAETTARHALELTLPWGNPSTICAAHTVLARIFQAQGKIEAAVNALNAAQAAFRGRSAFSDVLGELNSTQVKLWLSMGELSKASQWAQDWENNLDPSEAFSIGNEQDEITLSQLLIAKQQYEEALQILLRLAESAETGGRNGRLIEILVLQALALFAQKEHSEAFRALEKSLALARPEGYLRVFLDEGKPMVDLLTLSRKQGKWNTSPLKDYVDRLLNAFGDTEF